MYLSYAKLGIRDSPPGRASSSTSNSTDGIPPGADFQNSQSPFSLIPVVLLSIVGAILLV